MLTLGRFGSVQTFCLSETTAPPTFSMQEVRMVYHFDWSSSYAVAVLESDKRKLSERILEAELAIPASPATIRAIIEDPEIGWLF